VQPTFPELAQPQAHKDHGTGTMIVPSLWAGRQSGYAPPGAFRVNLTGKEERTMVTFHGMPTPRIFQEPSVTIDWPDMSIPALSRKQWEALVGILKHSKRPIYIGCGMGHGRTGTAAAIIATLWGLVPADSDPIKWIRSRYCSQAVETQSQVAYVKAITGRIVKESPSQHAVTKGDTLGSYPRPAKWEPTSQYPLRADMPVPEKDRYGIKPRRCSNCKQYIYLCTCKADQTSTI